MEIRNISDVSISTLGNRLNDINSWTNSGDLTAHDIRYD